MHPDPADDLRPTRRPGRAELALLWRQHRRWLAAVLLAHKRGDADLDDLLQEVALRVVEKIGSLRDPGAVRPWLRRIAVNVAVSEARRHRVRDRDAAGARASGTDEGRAQHRVEARDEADHALAIVRSLPPEYREPLILRSVRGVSQREIARALEISEEAVESRLARARRMVRARLRAAPGRKRSP